MCYNNTVLLKEGASIETSNKKLHIVPHWAFHCIYGRCTIGKSQSGNISCSIRSVFGIKIFFDVLYIIVAAAICFIFIGKLEGVREGSIIAAVLNGNIIKLYNSLYNKLTRKKLQTA